MKFNILEKLKIVKHKSLSNYLNHNYFFTEVTQEEFNNYSLYEGLIRSVSRESIFKYLNILKRTFPIKIYDNQEDQFDKLRVMISYKFQNSNQSKKLYDELLKQINLLGWFISMHMYDGKMIKKKDLNFGEFEKILTGDNEFICSLEPKYDIIISKLPKFLYHVSLVKYREKINKLGLTPRFSGKKLDHPDRIYVALNLQLAKYIKNKFVQDSLVKNIDEQYDIFEINVNNLILGTNFFMDPNFINLQQTKMYGCYTLSNIPPNAIELMKE